jgi:hypothetical protein
VISSFELQIITIIDSKPHKLFDSSILNSDRATLCSLGVDCDGVTFSSPNVDSDEVTFCFPIVYSDERTFYFELPNDELSVISFF